MKRTVGVVAIAGLLGCGAVATADAAPLPAPGQALAWGPCAREQSSVERALGLTPPPPATGEPVKAGVECATLRVPLDYREPYGQQIQVALNRIKGSAPGDRGHLGALLVNPGGPGASGKELAEYVAEAMPPELAGRFDVIGFDPRGVGGSQPSLRCMDPAKRYTPPMPDNVPKTSAEEAVLLGRAREYAARCGERWAWALPHLTTENSARDMDRVRQALGEEQISYLGYSYGTYLGAVYATLFPTRVKRLVMDSVVNPDEIWYQANLAQNRSFEQRHRAFLAWTARHRKTYRLGRTAKQASFAWYATRKRLKTRPAGGVVGPSELDELFTLGGYTDSVWPELAGVWSAYVRKNDEKGLVTAYRQYVRNGVPEENSYAVYLGVQCGDAPWPRKWQRWRADMTAMYAKAPFLTWANAWYNAPCAFWPVRGGRPVQVRGSAQLPPVLMLQSKGDAATPYRGALAMLRRFPTARMAVDPGGNHGLALVGNACVDRILVGYLGEGRLPSKRSCPKQAEPSATERLSARVTDRPGRLAEILGRRG